MGCELTALYATAGSIAAQHGAPPGRLSRVGAAFRRFRKTRPFWGGLWAIVAGGLITYVPLTAFKFTFAAQNLLWAGALVGILISVMGVFIWVQPQLRQLLGVGIVLLSLFSFITSDFGGLFVGMLLGIAGGSLAFGWTSNPPLSRREREAAPRAALRSSDVHGATLEGAGAQSRVPQHEQRVA